MAQLAKLPDVISFKEFDPEDSISCELLLIKVANEDGSRTQVLDAADAFHAKIVDYSRGSIVFRMAGQSRRIDNFIDLMRDFRILEVCRTGVVSLERGGAIMRNVSNI